MTTTEAIVPQICELLDKHKNNYKCQITIDNTCLKVHIETNDHVFSPIFFRLMSQYSGLLYNKIQLSYNIGWFQSVKKQYKEQSEKLDKLNAEISQLNEQIGGCLKKIYQNYQSFYLPELSDEISDENPDRQEYEEHGNWEIKKLEEQYMTLDEYSAWDEEPVIDLKYKLEKYCIEPKNFCIERPRFWLANEYGYDFDIVIPNDVALYDYFASKSLGDGHKRENVTAILCGGGTMKGVINSDQEVDYIEEQSS